MQEIFHRVSIRRYQERAVAPGTVEQLLRAAMAAPSAGNQQPWEFYLVTNPDTIARLAAASPYAGCAKNAPLVIVPAYREDVILPEYAQIDLSIACENLWLAADALGLGTVWLGIAPVAERMQAVEQIVGIPAGQRAFALFPVGYPAESKAQQDRYRPERVHTVR